MKPRATIRVLKIEDGSWEATAGIPYGHNGFTVHEVLFGQGKTRRASLLELDRLLGQACAEVLRRLHREDES